MPIQKSPDIMPPREHRGLAIVLRGFTAAYKSSAQTESKALHVPALERLIAESQAGLQPSRQSPGLDYWQHEVLAALRLEQQTSYASAPMTRLGPETAIESGTWLHAQPVQLTMSSHGLTLQSVLALSPIELQSIGDRLREHLASAQMTWHVSRDNAFLHTEKNLSAQTFTALQAMTLGLRDALPQGTDSKELRRVMTEIQMLLHEQPTLGVSNASRPSRANAIWLWGAGNNSPALPISLPQSLPQLWTDNDYARGVYLTSNNTSGNAFAIDPLPKGIEVIASQIKKDGVIVTQVHDLANCNQRWFEPLEKALHRGQLPQLDIYLDGWHVSIQGSWWRRWLKRTVPMDQLLAEPVI